MHTPITTASASLHAGPIWHCEFLATPCGFTGVLSQAFEICCLKLNSGAGYNLTWKFFWHHKPRKETLSQQNC